MIPVGFAGASSSYSITNSIRLNGTSDYLSKTLTTSATTSGSVWVKRSKLGATSPIFDNKVYFTSGDALYAFGLTSTALYRDPSAWYHIFWNGTGVYVNGTLVTGTGSYAAASVTNPRLGFDGTNYFSGYLSDFAFWNGSSASLQGGAADANGVWAAKRPSAGYSFLAFGSSGALGTDTSGNGNTWTVNGSPVQTTDTPTNNACTLNPVNKASDATLTNGAMSVTFGTNDKGVTGTQAVVSGKYYFEGKFDSVQGSRSPMFGLCNASLPMNVANIQTNVNKWVLGSNGSKYNTGNPDANLFSAFSNTGVTGIAVDATNPNSISVWFRNASGWSGDPVAGTGAAFTGIQGPLFPVVVTGDASAAGTLNFGATAFTYTPPTGFKALCTANLPAVSIKKPSDHFNVVLAAGASIKSSSEALYTYFLEWIKDRANSNNHQLIDTGRGTSAVLQSNSTGAETTYSAPSGSSVGWVWNAGSAASSNTSGSITSSVSANTTAGMSVVTYTGTGANATIGHGLGAAPKMFIVRLRSTLEYWWVYHVSAGNTGRLNLDTTGAFSTNSTVWNNTTPTAAVFSVGTHTEVNTASETYVAYCFAEIPGYSKFGSFTGNGLADGPFVYCGFRPRYILIKRTDTAGYSWEIHDAARNPSNVVNELLYANSANAADATSPDQLFDFTATGLKLRGGGGTVNANGGTYIFVAFAEYPFGGSNVAPSPAR